MSSFYQLVESLLREPGERAAYIADPGGYLPSHGFGDFSPEDVELSMQLVADSVPPALAELIDPASGLDSVMAVDVAEVPGLFDHAYDANGDDRSGLEEIVGEDDPFFDDELGPDTESNDAGESTNDTDFGEELGTDLGKLDEISQENGTTPGIGVESDHDGPEVSDGLTNIDTSVVVAVDEGFAGEDVSFDAANADDLAESSFGDVTDSDLDDLFE